MRSLLLIPLLFGLILAQESTTVIDILSENVEFSSFLRVLQKNQLIPYLNRLENFTLIAPVNSAFVCNKDQCSSKFNIELSNYIITHPISSLDFNGVQIFNSINNNPVIFNINKSENSFKVNNIDVVEYNLFANDQNAFVQGIDQKFNLIDLDNSLKTYSNIEFFKDLVKDYNKPLDNTTLLIPLDGSLYYEDYELNYLFSDYGINDRTFLLNSLIIDDYYGGNINKTVYNRNGDEINISSTDFGKHVTLNNTLSSINFGYSNNSIFHFFSDSNLIPKIQFNPMKVLIGLGASNFIDELLLQDLSYLITDNNLNQTIFYLKDANHQISINSKSSNLYHFVEERIEDLSTSKSLYNTRFCNSKKLGKSCQKIKIQSIGENSYMLNNNVLIESGPFKVGNTVIYLTDDNVRTPNDLLSSVNPAFHCTKSMNLLLESKLNKFANNELGYTIFLPCYNSFKDFELTLNYLKKDKNLMDKILKNFILQGLVYTDISKDVELFNLNNELVEINHLINYDDGLNLNLNNDSIFLKKDDDILFNQGVIHPIKKLLIPNDIQVNLGNIISSSISSENFFLSYLKYFDYFDDILNSEDDYSILVPSRFKLKFFESNSTLEKFLKIHTIPKVSLPNLYNCDDSIQTLDPKVNLTCTKISENNLFLSIENGADNGVHVFSKGCTNNDAKSCVYLIDKPINLDWIDDNSHYHISLPGIALGIGIILGSLLMILVLSCLMLIILNKRKSAKLIINEEEANDENSTLINNTETNEHDYESTNNFEAGYSGNANIDPINFPQKKRVI